MVMEGQKKREMEDLRGGGKEEQGVGRSGGCAIRIGDGRLLSLF